MGELVSVNPVDGTRIGAFPEFEEAQIEAALRNAQERFREWSTRSIAARAQCLRQLADALRGSSESLARLATREMGKRLVEARAEVEKCASACDHYATRGPDYLADEMIASDAGRSLVVWQPLGPLLLVMPWNFPFWQVLRQAVPATLAGNTVLLKHASNVPGCAAAIEEIFLEAGFPRGVFVNLPVRSERVGAIVGDARVRGVSLTGSESAGRAVAAAAGTALKKTVLELGGSDAFVVLADADLEETVAQALRGRFQNNGETCIAAKRFIVEQRIADAFVQRFRERIEGMRVGDPMDETTDLGPLARADLVDELDAQVQRSIEAGARCITGGQRLVRAGFFYAPTLLDGVRPGMAVFDEETFGPVAAVIRADGADDAVRLANASRYGLGGSVWTRDPALGEQLARRLECGCAFVNGLVKSDPRLPFGGVKDSGYGRELSALGIREFVNAKTLWVR